MQVVKKSDKIIAHTILIIGSVIMLYPFVFALLGTMVSVEEFYSVGFLPVPEDVGHLFENLARIFGREEILPSIVLTLARFVWYTIFVTASSVLAGYVFS